MVDADDDDSMGFDYVEYAVLERGYQCASNARCNFSRRFRKPHDTFQRQRQEGAKAITKTLTAIVPKIGGFESIQSRGLAYEKKNQRPPPDKSSLRNVLQGMTLSGARLCSASLRMANSISFAVTSTESSLADSQSAIARTMRSFALNLRAFCWMLAAALVIGNLA